MDSCLSVAGLGVLISPDGACMYPCVYPGQISIPAGVFGAVSGRVLPQFSIAGAIESFLAGNLSYSGRGIGFLSV